MSKQTKESVMSLTLTAEQVDRVGFLLQRLNTNKNVDGYKPERDLHEIAMLGFPLIELEEFEESAFGEDECGYGKLWDDDEDSELS
jgi:hypothetical protein